MSNMKAKMVIGAIAALFFATVGTTDSQAKSRVFEDPHVGSKLLDGCYSWPGPCRSRRQANAFCQERDYDKAIDFEVSNKVGVFQTRRLGDNGVCTASCSVMVMVECED